MLYFFLINKKSSLLTAWRETSPEVSKEALVISPKRGLEEYLSSEGLKARKAVANSFRQTVKFISFHHKLLYNAEA
jgi:hypothetical protein